MTAPRLEPIRATLADRGADAFVHAGPPTDPRVRYCAGRAPRPSDDASTLAAAVTADDELVVEPGAGSHPAERLADGLRDRRPTGTILTPPSIPHDAALYLERAGFDLASTDALDRARAGKTPAEIERIDRAQTAAAAGLRRAASVLAGTSVADGRLRRDGEVLTRSALRRAADAAVVNAGGFPIGATRLETAASPDGDAATATDEALGPGEPLIVRLAPHDPSGYRAAVARTLVPGTDGGWERRAHVAVESALRSARAMLAADPATPSAVETELAAEIRSFGFGEGASGAAHGVGLEFRERPRRGDEIDDGAVLAVRARVEREDGAAVELSDLLERRDGDARWLARPSRSLDPAAHAAE